MAGFFFFFSFLCFSPGAAWAFPLTGGIDTKSEGWSSQITDACCKTLFNVRKRVKGRDWIGGILRDARQGSYRGQGKARQGKANANGDGDGDGDDEHLARDGCTLGTECTHAGRRVFVCC